MIRRITRPGAIGLLVAALAACSSNPVPTVSPSVPAASVVPSSTPVASAPAASSGSASGAPATSVPSGATAAPSEGQDLLSVLPDTLGGHTLTKSVVTGAELAANPYAVTQELRDTLAKLGRGPGDLTVATAADMSGQTNTALTAFRVRGVPAQAFLDAYTPYLTTAVAGSTLVAETVAGKPTQHVHLPAGTYHDIYLVARSDILFLVASSDAALVNEAVGVLP